MSSEPPPASSWGSPETSSPPAWGSPAPSAPTWGTPAPSYGSPTGSSTGGWSAPPPPFSQPPQEPFLLRRAVLIPLTALVFFGLGYAVSAAVTVAENIDLGSVFDDIESGTGNGDGAGTSIEGVQRFGDLSLSRTRVREDIAGDFEVIVQVENRGSELGAVTITAFLIEGGDRIGEVSSIESFEADETRDVTLIGFDDYVDTFDDIEFEVDE